MGSKNSKIASSPTSKECGTDATESGEEKHGSRSPKTRQKDKAKKRTRRLTLDPLSYFAQDVAAAMVADQKLENSSLDVKNKLTDSLKSLRSDASASDASWYTDNSSVELIDYEAFEYPFENVIFEGGGNKGLAYAGAIREMEKIGVWNNIKRLGGASAGAMTATLMAIGYNSQELKEFLSMNLQTYFLDATCATCSLLPNLLRYYGWHPARRLFEWFGDRLEEMTGNADITFKQLYEQMGKELCIVVTNLNHMDAEYCHVKTTPNMPIRTAVRMSMAIPGLFGAVRSKKGGSDDYYVDGGVLCNYPIHCYDGWWLSMKPEDSMLRRLQPLEDIGKLWDKKERFGTINHKTIGLVLFSSDEQDVMVSRLQNRRTHNIKRPNTKLSRKRRSVKEIKDAALREHRIVTSAMSNFLRLLAESDVDESGTITRKELKQAFDKEVDYFPEGQRRKLFGNNYSVDDIFDHLNHENDDELTFQELQSFAERRGVAIQTSFEGYDRKEITSFKQFLGALTDTLLVNVKRIFTTDDDISRTIGIDTVYVGTTDFKLEEGDIQFLFEQGERAVRSYLRHYVRLHDPPLKKELRGGSTTESTLPWPCKEPKQRCTSADPISPPRSKQGSAVLSRTNLHIHTQTLNANGTETSVTAPRELSSLDGGPPIFVTKSKSNRMRLPPIEGTGHRSLSPGRGDLTLTGSRGSLNALTSPSVSPSPGKRDDAPTGSRGSLNGPISPRISPLPDRRDLPERVSPGVSPRPRDEDGLVRVRRGTRITPTELSNNAFDSHDA